MVSVTSDLVFFENLHVEQGWTLLALSLYASFHASSALPTHDAPRRLVLE